jgi:hypothetical protein
MSMLRHLCSIHLIVLGLFVSGLAWAQDDASDEDSESGEGPKDYAEVITADAESDEGLFIVHRLDDKVYFEIPVAELGEDMLLVTRIGRVPAGLDGYIVAGTKVAEQVLRWEQRDDRVLLRKISYREVADESLPIFESVASNNFAPILAAFDIAAVNEDADSIVVNVTDFYAGDTPALSGLSAEDRDGYKVRSLDTDRSFINYARSYPLNVDVRHTLTYVATEPPANSNTGTISMEMHQSMVKLPEDPMMPRRADDRVGYFSITQINFGLDELKAA